METLPGVPIFMKAIGYELNGKIYAICTVYGGPVISNGDLNVYTNRSRKLKKDYQQVIYSVTGNKAKAHLNVVFEKRFQGGRVFITRLSSKKCEFKIKGKLKNFDNEGLSLRNIIVRIND